MTEWIVARPHALGEAVMDVARRSLGAEPLPVAGRVGIVLSGGATPARYLPDLAAGWPCWDRTDILLSDERHVPVADPASNEGMARRHLTTALDTPGCRFVTLGAGTPDAEGAARRAEHEIAGLATWPARLALLGIGTDGHTASLFPDTNPQFGTGRLCVAVPPAGSREPRISMTLDALASIHRLVFVISGDAKRAIMRNALDGTDDTPLARLMSRAAGRTTVIHSSG